VEDPFDEFCPLRISGDQSHAGEHPGSASIAAAQPDFEIREQAFRPQAGKDPLAIGRIG